MSDVAVISVDLPPLCFGLVVNEQGVVVGAPPVARYTYGWTAARAWDYFRGRGAALAWVSTRP